MKRILLFCMTLLTTLLLGMQAVAEPVIPREEFPYVNSAWNLNNTGIYFTDGEYFFVNGGDGKFYRLDNQLQLDRVLFDDSVYGISRVTYVEDEQMLYFVADRANVSKNGGLFKVRFRDGVTEGTPQLLVKGVVANYAIDKEYICYHVDESNGIYRIDHNGENPLKLSNHQVQKKNPAVRMHIEDGTLYYINISDHYLWSVPLDASQQPKVYIDRPMHYYIMAPYKGERICIYVEYAPNTGELDKSHLAVVNERGERIRELDFLRDIQSRYINYYNGVLYYIDSSEEPQMPRWVDLNSQASGSVAIEGQNDLKAFQASDGMHWKFNNRVGYIHVFDGWIVMAELGDTFRFYNPQTGRSDVYGGAGTDIWFVNLETLVSYRCHTNK